MGLNGIAIYLSAPITTISRSSCSLLMITIYRVIQVVFWFYNLSITFASVVVCMHENWSWSQVLHIISVTWELTPPHRGGFCNYILSCQTLLLVVYHAPYVSHRDIIVVLISGPNPSGPEPMEIWEKRLVNNVPTICYWTTVREYLLINCRFIRGQRVGHWPLTLNSCNELCPCFSPLDTQTMPAGYSFSWKTWQSYQMSTQQSMMLSWRECVLYNGVIRSVTVVVLDMVAVAHIS